MDSSRGQGDAFMILIGSILGLLILLIVLGVIASFEKTECDSSIHSLFERFRTSVNLPTGEIIAQKNLRFCAGNVFTRQGFANRESLNAECVILDGEASNGLEVEPPFAVRFKNAIRADAYFACAKPPFQSDFPPFDAAMCRTACWIGFNKNQP